MQLPAWPARDWRALVALIASIVGSATLTGFASWLVWILWKGGWPASTADARISALSKALLGTLFTVAIVLISLGLAINRRSVKATALGASFEATGGDDPASGTVAAATAGAVAGVIAGTSAANAGTSAPDNQEK